MEFSEARQREGVGRREGSVTADHQPYFASVPTLFVQRSAHVRSKALSCFTCKSTWCPCNYIAFRRRRMWFISDDSRSKTDSRPLMQLGLTREGREHVPKQGRKHPLTHHLSDCVRSRGVQPSRQRGAHTWHVSIHPITPLKFRTGGQNYCTHAMRLEHRTLSWFWKRRQTCDGTG